MNPGPIGAFMEAVKSGLYLILPYVLSLLFALLAIGIIVLLLLIERQWWLTVVLAILFVICVLAVLDIGLVAGWWK